ncbi:MAG: AAA family ATPase [Fibrobacteria bacterium]
MPNHPDAIAYINDLAAEINEPWFKMVCDLAALSGTSVLDEGILDALFALYQGRASYIGNQTVASFTSAGVAAVSADTLEQLSSFANFKLLGDALDVSFKKRITLIFGSNGSGKSSLCESLKVLATPGQPSRPLQNVRTGGATTPTFRFKFKNDASPQTWTPAVGYGPRQATVKYFDTSIAVQNVTNAVEPGRVIIVAPFKLHIFEWVKALTTKFREALQVAQRKNSEKLGQALLTIRTHYAKFKTRPLAIITDLAVSGLAAQIKLGEEFQDQELLREKRVAATELEKATSEEGLKLLRAEHRELELFLTALKSLVTSATELWALEPANKAITLAKKQGAQEELAKELIPKSSSLDSLLSLLRTASSICKMDEATDHACPLCKRGLGLPEVDLFKRYHGLLVGELEKDIIALKDDLTRAREIAVAVGLIDRKAWDKCTTIPEDVLTAAKAGADLIAASCDISIEPTAEAKAALESIKASVVSWTGQIESKKAAIDAAAEGRDEMVKQLGKLRLELEPLEYAQVLADGLEKLREAQQMGENAQFWSTKLPAFTQVLKRITETAKVAHEDLVVTDFEARLDAEYQSLAEKNMAAFGVKLARKGTDASVTVLPHVGGKGIDGVLSEGEQRLHALALFFAELETCPHSVVVFDDPISSFDYNYITNYCSRLRDFAMKFPDRQIIALTHNWEFFVQLQSTLNNARLDGQLSIQVLENCSVVADFSEKANELKAEVIATLAVPGEPSKAVKEEMAGKMRRLIESLVNTHVFNNQRHQYKQKSQPVSDFHKFTKLVSLLPAEAATLRDLFGKLSISEHDDPRNAYVNTDKATFLARYHAIIAIEASVISRK